MNVLIYGRGFIRHNKSGVSLVRCTGCNTRLRVGRSVALDVVLAAAQEHDRTCGKAAA